MGFELYKTDCCRSKKFRSNSINPERASAGRSGGRVQWTSRASRVSCPICMHLRILAEMGVFSYTGSGDPLITGDILFERASKAWQAVSRPRPRRRRRRRHEDRRLKQRDTPANTNEISLSRTLPTGRKILVSPGPDTLAHIRGPDTPRGRCTCLRRACTY